VGSLDHSDEPDQPDQPERRGKPGKDGSSDRAERSGNADRPGSAGESESRAAERLGLTALTRGEFYETQRSQADAQEAALQQRDGPDKMPWGRSGPKRDAPDIGVERWWSHPPEERPERDVEIGRGYYWTEVPRFLANWQHIEERWPGNRRSKGDGPVSGGGDSRYDVSPERRAGAAEAVDKLPEAEPPISENVKKVEGENVRGGWLEGYEFRLKGKERLTEKVMEALEAQQDSTPEEVVSRIPDAIRYTFCLEHQDYTAGYWDIKDHLESAGYEMYQCKNSWTDQEYKGINTRWMTPQGQRFEMQFHTPESFHAKHEVTHHAYERLRSTQTSRAERRELRVFQREVSAWIPIPGGVAEIPDYKKEGF
jgi:hypothetical protein